MKPFITVGLSVLLCACTPEEASNIVDRTSISCGNHSNCVSTEEQHDRFIIAPFILRPSVTLQQIERIALTLPGAKTAEKADDYLRIECTSRILRFVDDLELKLQDNQLLIRSQSRTGYSDFGGNQRRIETLREKMIEAGMLL